MVIILFNKDTTSLRLITMIVVVVVTLMVTHQKIFIAVKPVRTCRMHFLYIVHRQAFITSVTLITVVAVMMMMVTIITVKNRLLWSLLEPAECTWIVTLASLWFQYFVDMCLTTLLLLLVYPRTHLWDILIHFASYKLLTVLRFNLKSTEICCHWRSASPCSSHILKYFSMKLFIWLAVWLTPSLPEPVKCSGWKMHRNACKQYIFRSYNFYFQCFYFFDANPFTWQWEK